MQPPDSHQISYLNMCRIGGARVLMVGVVLWSLGTLVAPPAAKISLLALCASRVFVSGSPVAFSLFDL